MKKKRKSAKKNKINRWSLNKGFFVGFHLFEIILKVYNLIDILKIKSKKFFKFLLKNSYNILVIIIF